MRKYWFKPKQFWRWFAAYYPVTPEGWLVTVAAVVTLLVVFLAADAVSRSASDTLMGTIPGVLIVLLIFDIISFRTGEYPAWWKHKKIFDSNAAD